MVLELQANGLLLSVLPRVWLPWCDTCCGIRPSCCITWCTVCSRILLCEYATICLPMHSGWDFGTFPFCSCCGQCCSEPSLVTVRMHPHAQVAWLKFSFSDADRLQRDRVKARGLPAHRLALEPLPLPRALLHPSWPHCAPGGRLLPGA